MLFMKNNALILFVRNPLLGKVKTRLAKTIGDIEALQVYKELLLHTMEQTVKVSCDKFLFYDTEVVTDDIWPAQHFTKYVQEGLDLGQRMENAFQKLFTLGYKNAVIIGSDLFDLKSNHIESAFQQLVENDVVIGPAEDGGYYLLGLKKVFPSIFKDKEWGTSSVLEQTLKDIVNCKVSLLETLNDIDTFEDLQKHRNKG